MEAVFLKVLNMGISAGWLILAAAALRLLLKKAPKWLPCALWAVVAVRLVCPYSLESALSLIPSAETVSPEILYAEKPAIHSGIAAVNRAVNPMLQASFAPNPVQSVNPLQIWTLIAAWAWLAGIAALLICAAVSYGKLRRKVAASLPAGGNVRICDEIDTPFILGVFRPKIYLPSGLDKAQRPSVIAHETAHLRRGDNLWKPLGFLLLAVYWFQPLCWLAYILLCRDIELACDERAVRTMDRDGAIAYSRALLACSVPRGKIAACPLAFGEVGVKERVKNILNYKKPAFWLVILAVCACAAVAVCFLTNPATSKQAAAAASSAPDGESRIYTDTQIYLSPLSSAYPGGSSGYSYSISSDGTLTFSKSGEAPVVLPRSKPWTRLTQAEWKALFKPDTFAPDISGVKKPLVSKLSERYYLFSMDGALWLGDYRNATVGMWSIYALTPDTAADSSSQQDDEAALRAKYFDFAVDWRLDYIPVFPAAGQTGAPSVSSDYLMWAFMLDYDRLSAQGDMEKDYVERQIKSHFEVTSLRHEGLRETWNFDGEKYTPYAGGIKGKPMALLKSLSQAEENGRTVYTLKLDFLTADHPLENPPEDSAEWRSLRQNIIDQQTDGLSVLSTDVFRFYLQSGEPVFLSHTQENASGQTEAVPLARCLTLFPGSTRALLNGEEIPLASAPYRENGNLYLPLEQTAAIFGISAAPVSGKSGQYAVSSGGDTLLFTEGQADFTILYSTGEQTAVTAEAAPENRDGVFCVPAKSAQFANINQAADLSQVILSEASPDELRAGPFQCNEPYDELPSDVRAEFTEQPVTDATLKAMGARRLVSADVELLVMKGGGYGPADAENILEIHLKTDRYHTARGLYVGAMAALDTELYGFPGPAADVVRVQVASKISNGLISEIVLHTMV